MTDEQCTFCGQRKSGTLKPVIPSNAGEGCTYGLRHEWVQITVKGTAKPKYTVPPLWRPSWREAWPELFMCRFDQRCCRLNTVNCSS